MTGMQFMTTVIIEEWYFKPLPVIIPLEYFCFKVFAEIGTHYIILNFIVMILILFSYFAEKFSKEMYYTLY